MSVHVLAVKDSGWMVNARSSSGNCCVLCLAFKDDHKAWVLLRVVLLLCRPADNTRKSATKCTACYSVNDSCSF